MSKQKTPQIPAATEQKPKPSQVPMKDLIEKPSTPTGVKGRSGAPIKK